MFIQMISDQKGLSQLAVAINDNQPKRVLMSMWGGKRWDYQFTSLYNKHQQTSDRLGCSNVDDV